MKATRIICVFICITITCRGLAQEPASGAENQQQNSPPTGAQKVEALKIAFISQNLNLTPEEAEKFWPVYNNYQHEMQKLVNDRKQFQLNNKTIGTASDAEVGQSLNEEFGFRQKALEIQQKYKSEFLKVLPPRKVLTLYKSETDFKKRLIRELRARGGLQGNRQQGNRQMIREQKSQAPVRHFGGGGGRRKF